uniref:HAT C-terminal dimerisation domain-containing protein n=1 Tax=Chenopodium quinoa TaxID=63459 RepID=A0A803LSZ0_CHEQI
METLNEIYELYVSENPLNDSIPPKTSDFLEEVEDMDSDVDVAELEFEKDVGSSVGVQGKNELAKYPTIALMARDVLAIPVSTVASESAFSTGGRVLDSFRNSLSTKMVEALICAQDWLRTSQGLLILEERLEDMEKIESEEASKKESAAKLSGDEAAVGGAAEEFGAVDVKSLKTQIEMKIVHEVDSRMLSR